MKRKRMAEEKGLLASRVADRLIFLVRFALKKNLYPFQLKMPTYDKGFFRKNHDRECRLYQVIQPNSSSEFLQKRQGQKLASSV
ncbi:MAG: hypothetical protein FJX34_05045, partial [Alphaproteobacteria bacterium]|nr:hypothetical protein [Alphaproteobacteria bacterium]